MAGHSKWHNIRVRKMRQDLLRGRLFSKLAREITVAARLGGGDPDSNPRLRAAIDRAKEHGMPMDNIERAIKKEQVNLKANNTKRSFTRATVQAELLS